MVAQGAIQPVIYKTPYQGLDSIVKALEDLEARKVWGRAVVTLSEDMESSTSKI
jgi:NADPH2:quinone reductase